MSKIKQDSIEQAQVLYKALMNRQTRLTQSLDEVLAALKAGKSDILIEIPWGEARPDGLVERHQVILTQFNTGRYFFINALKNQHPVGTVITGPGKGPERRVEEGGLESMDMRVLSALFAKGGKAMMDA